MSITKLYKYLFIALLLIPLVSLGQSKEKESINFFVECNCDKNYIRQEIKSISHVRDQGLANVQLFIYDLTNGRQTYKGGRYIDLKIPEGNKIQIDFNTAYQPYCAYTSGYACPIPPISNSLKVPIEAGVRF